VLEPDYFENSEIYCTIEDFLILKELYNLTLHTNSKWSREQKQCWAHEVPKWIW